ncbi:MAG: hydrolase, partial [Gemmatimonadota bacterium]|nr:hydrolase [Gemmatimonadota bacterium]
MSRRLIILIAVFACTPLTRVGPASIIIRNVTVIPMTSAAPSPGQSVTIRNGRITEMGTSAQLRVPPGATVLDGTGKYL